MTNSLGKRLTYRIMAVVLVMMAVIAGIVYYMVREYMLEEAQERYEGVLLRDHEEFRRRLSDVMVATNNHLYDIEQEVDEPEKIMPRLERSLSPLFDCKDRDIVIDCSDLNYISSSGLRIMLNIYKHARANGHDAILKAMNEEVEEVFSLSGFLQLFKKES